MKEKQIDLLFQAAREEIWRLRNRWEAKKDVMSKAIALLTAYGATLDNKDHGTNLIHKLLIEGRLVVALLPDTVRHPN